MARQRKTLALIIICLPILTTVITAFRLRDLPKSHDVKKEKCDSCEVNIGRTIHSVKIESDKYLHEEPKKTVHEKDTLTQKFVTLYKYITNDDDDDDDDDDDVKPFQFKSENKKEKRIDFKSKPSITKVSPKSDNGKKEARQKVYGYDDDDDDDDDDDEDNEKLTNKRKSQQNLDLSKKPTSKRSIITSKLNTKIITQDSGDNEEDDFDDDDENEIKIATKKDTKKEVFGNKEIPGLSSQKLMKSESLVVKNLNLESTKTSHDSLIPENSKGINDTKQNENYKVDKSQDKSFNEKSKSIVEKKKLDNKSKKPSTDNDPLKSIEEILKFLVEDDEEESEKGKKLQSRTHIFPIKQSSKDQNKKELPVQKNEPRLTESEKLKSEEKENKSLGSKLKEEEKSYKITKKDIPTEKLLSNKETQEKTIDVKLKKESDKISKESVQVSSKISNEKTPKEKKIEGKKSAVTPNMEKKKEDKVKDDPVIVEIQKETKVEFEKKRHKRELEQKDKSSRDKFTDSREALTKSESHLKHVTDALHRKNLLKSKFEDFYAFLPTFAPNYSRIHNPECRRHGQIVLRQLRGMKLWALNMLDATAKIPSGLLQGNGNQLGDFDQCLASRARVKLDTGSVVKVQGKYCLARVDVKAEHPELETPVYLAQSKNLVRSRVDDPGHLVPRVSTLSWGICVPSACNPEDVEMVLKDAVKHYQHSGVAVRVKVDEQDCQVERTGHWWEYWQEIPTILTLSFYGVVFLLVLVATIQDFLVRREENENKEVKAADNKDSDEKDTTKRDLSKIHSDNVLINFSLYRSISKLIAPGNKDEIACIHGIRGIVSIIILIAHKFMPVAAMPYSNRLKITELSSSPVWSWCRAGWIFTDCFLLLSATLTTYSITKDQEKGAVKKLFLRYVRLTPALLAVVLFYAYVWDNISTGPLWGTWVTKNAQVCQQGWWWNLLYVQNYFGIEEMCAPQTHQLALDMQLTILGGLIVWAVQTKLGYFRLLIPGLHIIAAYSRYTRVREHRLTFLAYHGVSISQLYRTARLSYMSVLHRLTPYLVGITLGMALAKPTKHGKFVLTLGWLVSISLWILVSWAGWDAGSLQYRYNSNFAAQYAALAPIASALSIAWVIYAVNNGSCDTLARLLSCYPLILLSRLSYAVYLCQFIIFFTNVGTVKTSGEFTLTSLFDIKELTAIMLASIVLTLTFIVPVQSLYKVFDFKPRQAALDESNKNDNAVKKAEQIVEQQKVRSEDKREHQLKRQALLAHREVLEEIPEVEVEYEMQREKELHEIIEEEEGDYEDDSQNTLDDDLEIIEEEAGEEDVWEQRDNNEQRPISREDGDIDEWEWTANANQRNGAQRYSYTR